MMSARQAVSLALIAFGLSELFLRRGGTAKSLKTTATDQGTTLLILGSYGAVIAMLYLRRLPAAALPSSWGWAGVLLASTGLAIRWWAMAVLGRFYTRTLVTTSDQQVVNRGPYRFVRHPGYLGSLMTWLGAAIASTSFVGVVAIILVLLFTYARRIGAEEAMLVENLGPTYVDYQRRSQRLIPFVF